MRKVGICLFVILLLLAGGCARKVVRHSFIPTSIPTSEPSSVWGEVSGDRAISLTDDLDIESLSAAIDRSLQYYDRATAKEARFGKRVYTRQELKASLLAFRAIITSADSDEIKDRQISEGFDIIKAGGEDGQGSVLFTGYYAPALTGSLVRTERYRYPLYRPPPDTRYNREDIDTKGVLEGKNLEIAWVDDPVALFFLHIQGSGTVQLPEGRQIRVSYARSNDRPFRSIGKYMLEKGKLSERQLSGRSIRQYLLEHPDEQAEILNHNERYVFFRIVYEGPVGALGVPVTAGRSIAVDLDIFPAGAIALIKTRKPLMDQQGNVTAWVPFSRFVLAQDAGAAIKGPGRVDLFCGSGEQAGAVAGVMKEKGELYFLVKKK